ncbi:hypothetical protein NPD7_849 [Clostridium sporogenes]|nr:hypothetical protein NPD7_849 [Clostridium sporogenes]
MATYRINLDNIRITDTLSYHEDTDFVALAVRVGNRSATMIPPTIPKRIGDVNNGTHQVNIAHTIDVPEGEGITFGYMVVNSGNTNPQPAFNQLMDLVNNTKMDSANGDVNTKKDDSGKGWLETLVTLGLIRILDWLSGFFRDCDGTAALDAIAVSSRTLHEWTQNTGSFTQERPYKAKTCRDSQYYVKWTITRL